MKVWRKIVACCLAVVMICSCGFENLSISADSTNPSMKVTILNVGHGDAAVVESDGHFIVIDGGMYKYNYVLLNYLKKAGAKKIDLVISSHWDGDHIGGLNQVIRNYEIGAVWHSDYFVNNALTQNVMEAIKEKGCKAYTPQKGETYQVGDATVKVVADGRNAKEVSKSKVEDVISNNSSLIVKISCAGKSALFTGDARSEVEDKLSKADANCDILKASHHGNYYSTSAKFIKKATPEYAAISVGKNNKKGAPNFHIVYNLTNAGAVIGRTDRQGTLTYHVDNTGIVMTTQKKVTDISQAKITGIKKSYKYTGKKIMPVPKVKINGKLLYCRENKTCYTTSTKTSCYHFSKKCKSLKGVKRKYLLKKKVAKCETKKKQACGWCVKVPYDYKISYTANKKRGTATVTITGLGDKCLGTVTKTFTIR